MLAIPVLADDAPDDANAVPDAAASATPRPPARASPAFLVAVIRPRSFPAIGSLPSGAGHAPWRAHLLGIRGRPSIGSLHDRERESGRHVRAAGLMPVDHEPGTYRAANGACVVPPAGGRPDVARQG